MFSRPSLLGWLLALAAAPLGAQQLSLGIEDILHPAFEAEGISISADLAPNGAAEIGIKRLRGPGFDFASLRLSCRPFRFDGRELACPQGRLYAADQAPIPLALTYSFAQRRLRLDMPDVALDRLRALDPALAEWKLRGRASLHLVAERRRVDLSLKLHDTGFDSADGSRAGDGIALELAARAERGGQGWTWNASLAWPRGELYWAPWYRNAGLHADADGLLTDRELAVNQLRLVVDKLGSLSAGLRWDRQRAQPLRWGFVTDDIDFSMALQDWIQPWLDQMAFPKLVGAGRTRLSAEWNAGALQSFFVGLDDARVGDAAGHLGFTALSVSLPWQTGVSSEALIAAKGGHWGEFALGEFAIPIMLDDAGARLRDLSIPLLDGRIHVDDLRARHDGGEWRWNFSGGLEGVSMPKVSAALGLPHMAGSVSARIPDALYERNTATLGGDLTIDVFGGRLTATNLKILDPLARTQRFMADVEMRNVDLGQLTGAFSFGSIRGRFDGELKGLELQGWKPLRFDARIVSSAGDYPRSISRGALQDISAIGGAGGAQAVQSSPAALFNSFDYDRIGLGCRLRAGVCSLEGIADNARGIVLVEGRGIPSVKVIGYNRRIDWDLLVSRIRAVIAGKSKAVIE